MMAAARPPRSDAPAFSSALSPESAVSFADHEPGLWRAVITQALMDAASHSKKPEARRTRSEALARGCSWRLPNGQGWRTQGRKLATCPTTHHA